MKRLLVDGDIVAYRGSATAEERYYLGSDGIKYQYKKDVPENMECEFIREPRDEFFLFYILEKILYNCKAYGGEIIIFLTGKHNYREKLVNDYKGNRKDLSRPPLLQLARDYLANNYRSITSYGCEADDLLGEYSNDDSIIVSLDKDLEMIPTNHCSNLNPLMYYKMDEFKSFKWFCKQCLTGDAIDNIKGIKGIGGKTADKILNKVDEGDMKGLWIEVVLQYKERDELHRLHIVAMLLWIARPKYRFYYEYILKVIL